jgi:molybdate transport system substrate-binding protein
MDEPMNRRDFITLLGYAATALVAVFICGETLARAAELKILSAAGVSPVVNELNAEFERSTKHKLSVQFMDAPVVKREIDGGKSFDVAISVPTVIDELITQGKLAAGSRADFVRAGMGVGVRSGIPKPDIGTEEAFKRTLLNVKSVSYAAEGASGTYFTTLLSRLGISEDMRPKLRPLSPPANVQAVAKGDVDMVVGVASPIIAAPGVEFVGVLPPELQTYLRFAIAVGAATKEPDAAKALVQFFTSADAALVIRAKGMEPR